MARVRDLTRQSEHWPVGRTAAIVMVVVWAVITVAVLLRWIDHAPAAFLAAGVFTFVITLVLAYDAAVDWADPDEHESLARRLQPERGWPRLQGVTDLIRVWSVPVCFVVGVVVGHFEWH